MSARARAYFLLLIATSIWGVAGPVIKHTLDYLPPAVFLLYRFAISGTIAAFALAMYHQNGWPKAPIHKLWIILYCILNTTVALGLLFLGYDKTSAISGSILNAMYPVIVAVCGVLFLRERVTHREKIGMGLALVGTLLTVVEPYLSGQSTSSSASTLEGNVLVVASLLVGVLGTIMAKLLLRSKLSPIAMTHLSFLVGFLTTAPVVLYYYSPTSIIQSLVAAPLTAHAGVWYMALLSGTLAYSLWHIGQKSIEVGETALFSYLYPIFTLPLSYFWLHERLSWIYLVSVLVITSGVSLAGTKLHRR